jgi:hypothetical protein
MRRPATIFATQLDRTGCNWAVWRGEELLMKPNELQLADTGRDGLSQIWRPVL